MGRLSSLFSRSHWTDKQYPRPDARRPTSDVRARAPSLLPLCPAGVPCLLRDQQYGGGFQAIYTRDAMRVIPFPNTSPPLLSHIDSFAITMPSSHSSKHHLNSFVSSPTWSLNTLTGTTVSSGSGGLPVTPGMSPVSLPSPPGSARSVSMHSGQGHAYAYASQTPSTPGAPHMGTVPLPQHLQCAHITLPFFPIILLQQLSDLLFRFSAHTARKP